jgi:hypothetical protein
MSQVELYKGLIYTLPKQPKKEDIFGYKLPKKDQKWTRTELPENWEELDIKEQEVFAFEEDRRCTEGFWFMCNGTPTYITADHYHYLNWFKIDCGYPEYRDRDRRWFYHWELCDKDEECMGQIYGKHRRDGYSYRVDSIILNRARKTFNAKYGMVSKTGEDAKEMFNKLVHGFLEYPPFFKPQVQSAEDVKKELVFKTPQQRVTFKNRATKKEISLNTTIDWRNTKENAYDGMKLQILASDESAKNPVDVSIEKWFNIAKTCLVLGSRIIGKMLMGSTVNEAKKGGQGFLNIWLNSDTTNKTENGRTVSGLWRYFVTCADGLEGFIDEYGMSVIETPEKPVMGVDGKLIKKGARQWILDELAARKKAGDLVAFYEFKRQFPLTEEDMFASPANERTCWDIEKIQQQLEHNAIVSVDRSLAYGYFDWKNGERDCGIVEWHPVPREHHLAKHAFSWFPEVHDRNKFIIKNGKKAPGNSHVGLFTLDPYAAVNTVDGRQSKAASHGFKKFDFAAPKHQSEVFIGQYWNRLRDPLLVYEDMIMQAVFFGWPVIPERNIKNFNDYCRNRDYHNYLLSAPSMTEEEFNTNKNKIQDAGLANTAGKTQQQLVEYLASYIANHIGVNDSTGEMGYMPFDDTLRDWLAFDITKWTPYDLTISSMLATTTARGFVPKPAERSKIQLFKQYDNRGLVSKEIRKK